MVARRLDLRQGIACRHARHVVVGEYPGRGGTGFDGRLQALLDCSVHVIIGPSGLGELKVECLAKLAGACVEILALGQNPRLGNGAARRIITVEHAAPLAIDLMDLVAVPQRMGAVLNHVIALGEMPPVEVIAVEILGETVRHINAKAIDASIAPKRQDVAKERMNLGTRPVKVRLLGRKHVQIPLTVRDARPGGAAKVGIPIGGRQLAVLAATIAEDITGALG